MRNFFGNASNFGAKLITLFWSIYLVVLWWKLLLNCCVIKKGWKEATMLKYRNWLEASNAWSSADWLWDLTIKPGSNSHPFDRFCVTVYCSLLWVYCFPKSVCCHIIKPIAISDRDAKFHNLRSQNGALKLTVCYAHLSGILPQLEASTHIVIIHFGRFFLHRCIQ